MNRNIPPPLQALLETLEGAVIIGQTFYLNDLVGDAQIIAATPEAARLYGFEHPSELEGRFTSQLDHPDDYIAIKLFFIARLHGLAQVPHEYDMRIILPDGSIRYLRKQVTQMQYGQESYWVTTSAQIAADEAKPLPDYRHLLPEDAIREWFRIISVAELEQLIGTYVPWKIAEILRPSLTTDEIQYNMDEIQTLGRSRTIRALPAVTRPNVIEIGLGQTRHLPDNRYVHRCGNCGCTWASGNSNPVKCPRSRDDSRGPRCGLARWRIVTARGQESAESQAHELATTLNVK